MTITITTNNGKIYAEPDERMSAELFRVFRSNGWLWSRRASAFCFNDNENGAARVRKLFNGKFSSVYGVNDATKAEAAAIVFEYADEQTRAHFEQANEDAQAKREAEKAEKQRKTEQANRNKLEQIKKILDATRNLPNGWAAKLEYGFMNPILTTKDFFERGGLVICETVKTLAANYGIELPNNLNINDNDVLQLEIEYYFQERGYNYFNGEINPERREMHLTVSYWRKNNNGTMTSTSGNFHISIILAQDLKQRTLAGYRHYAEICGDEVKRAAVLLYLNYCNRNKEKAINASLFDRVLGNGTATLEQVLTACAA